MSISQLKLIEIFEVDMEYYERLRDLREDRELTQADIAELLQTTQEQISKYETGKQMMGIGLTKPKHAVVISIASE